MCIDTYNIGFIRIIRNIRFIRNISLLYSVNRTRVCLPVHFFESQVWQKIIGKTFAVYPYTDLFTRTPVCLPVHRSVYPFTGLFTPNKMNKTSTKKTTNKTNNTYNTNKTSIKKTNNPK
jgi:hypothetical protein